MARYVRNADDDYESEKLNEREVLAKKLLKAGLWAGAGVLVLIIVFGSFVIVPAGNRGVLTTWGRAVEIRGEGLNLKWPIMNHIELMSVQTQKVDASATAASKDLQDVSTQVALNYKLDPNSALTVYRDLSVNYAASIIQPAVQETVKANTAQFTAEELITKRATVKSQIDDVLTERLARYGIIVDAISITEFSFSPEFTQAIEAKVTAQQQALKADNDLQRIKIEAEQTVASAQAQAEALRLVNEQLRVSPLAIQLELARKWDGHLSTYYVSGSNDKSSGLMTMLPIAVQTS